MQNVLTLCGRDEPLRSMRSTDLDVFDYKLDADSREVLFGDFDLLNEISSIHQILLV